MNMKFSLGRGKDVREINITEAYEAIVSELASSILGFHSFAGCDFTVRFNGKSKRSAWKLFIQSDTVTLSAFTSNANTNINEVISGL